eukprot:1787610-Rhodomonas_salina.2
MSTDRAAVARARRSADVSLLHAQVEQIVAVLVEERADSGRSACCVSIGQVHRTGSWDGNLEPIVDRRETTAIWVDHTLAQHRAWCCKCDKHVQPKCEQRRAAAYLVEHNDSHLHGREEDRAVNVTVSNPASLPFLFQRVFSWDSTVLRLGRAVSLFELDSPPHQEVQRLDLLLQWRLAVLVQAHALVLGAACVVRAH